MDILIQPSKLKGTIRAIPSKSMAHRVLICSAFSDCATKIICRNTSLDIEATVDCLNALGTSIQRNTDGYYVEPIHNLPSSAHLYCRESGSTLRFLLPVVGALGLDTTFHLDGSLPDRPLSPLWEVMQSHGCHLTHPTTHTIRCHGKLLPGDYIIAGNVSSQFISGLLIACSLMNGESGIYPTSKIQSFPYVQMTQNVLKLFGTECADMNVHGRNTFHSPRCCVIEGDWSNAAFYLAANVLGSSVTVENLNMDSVQGDRRIIDALSTLQEHCTIDVADIPDLVPILCLVACCKKGAIFKNTARLRFKESDRVAATLSMLASLGCSAEAHDNEMVVHPGIVHGGVIESFGDHRIAMTAAIAATIADGAVLIRNAQCVQKSYPGFWDDYCTLGGNYEQFLW